MSKTSSYAAEEHRKQLDYATSIAKLYARHASSLIAHFDDWKGKDEFYFIELRLDMAYVSTGFISRMANPPYFLGTMIRNSLLHPDLFGCRCPNGHQAYAYSYTGSPLSGNVSQSMACPMCGWNQTTERSGWHNRSLALKAALAEDSDRYRQALTINPEFKPADLRVLLKTLGIPEEDLELPEIDRRIEKWENADCIFQRDPYGGVKIEDTNTGRITCYQWHGLNEL